MAAKPEVRWSLIDGSGGDEWWRSDFADHGSG